MCLGTAGQDCTDTYVVQPNDTCEEVADANKVDLGVLYQNNPQLHNPTCNNMYVGEVCVLGLSA